MPIRWIAGFALVLWLSAGLLLTLQPVDPPPGYVVRNNLVPFQTIAFFVADPGSPFWVRQFAGNLLLLLPVGLLAPVVLPALKGWIRIFLVSLALSVAIELAQLAIPNRSADVDDILLNVVGAMLGYALFLLLRLGAGPRRATPRATEP